MTDQGQQGPPTANGDVGEHEPQPQQQQQQQQQHEQQPMSNGDAAGQQEQQHQAQENGPPKQKLDRKLKQKEKKKQHKLNKQQRRWVEQPSSKERMFLGTQRSMPGLESHVEGRRLHASSPYRTGKSRRDGQLQLRNSRWGSL